MNNKTKKIKKKKKERKTRGAGEGSRISRRPGCVYREGNKPSSSKESLESCCFQLPFPPANRI
jgi:hypothetical protein